MATAKAAIAERKQKGRYIPDAVQQPIRERLRMLRLSRSKHVNEISVPGLSPGTLTSFELHDVSTMTMLQIYSLSKEYGVDFYEFVQYLFDTEGTEGLAETRNENLRRIMRLVQALDEADQGIVLRQVDALFDGRETRSTLIRAGVPLEEDRPRLAHVGASP